MAVILGIDTGGTYTDVVLWDNERGIISTAKAPTTKQDLSVGIEAALKNVLPEQPNVIDSVSLSTTLATNAIVEEKGMPVCLILIGYPRNVVSADYFRGIVPEQDVAFIQGGHNVAGDELAPLDIKALRQTILQHAPQVLSFAISSYFSTRNPEHELRAKRLVQRLTDKSVTCGHEITTDLHAPRRALTAALNASLVPLLQSLVIGVDRVLSRQSITAPLKVVRGDGSLMDKTIAIERPIETILSGPAASAVGAHYLSKIGDAYTIDMGGTTTDITRLCDKHLAVNQKGARVGNWDTMVEAIDVRTIGLGGDSEIWLDQSSNLRVGPKRVIPLSYLAKDYPSIISTLKTQAEDNQEISPAHNDFGRLVLKIHFSKYNKRPLTSKDEEILGLLDNGPADTMKLFTQCEYPSLYRRRLEKLIDAGFVAASAFTPTDAIHVLGCYEHGSVEAAWAGATLWANHLGIGIREFCNLVVREVKYQVAHEVIEKILSEEGIKIEKEPHSAGDFFINRAILGSCEEKTLSVKTSINKPLIGIGAASPAYLPFVAEQLGTHLYLPKHAEVASAVGAAVCGVLQTVRVLIRPLAGQRAYRVHLSFGTRDFRQLEQALAYAKHSVRRLVREKAHKAGAEKVQLQVIKHERSLPMGYDKVYIDIEVIGIAWGYGYG